MGLRQELADPSAQCGSGEARPGVAVKTPRWCVERRGGLREEVVFTRTWLRHSAHHPPFIERGTKGMKASPVPQTIRAAERWLFEN